jgi:hypothetical protein
LKYVWEKPVIVFYKERTRKPERKAFAVVKARRLAILMNEGETKIEGNMNDFFPLMGNIDYISSEKGISESYVVCWLEDKEDDFKKAWRRLVGVTFPAGVNFIVDEDGKKTYNTNLKAKQGKLK